MERVVRAVLSDKRAKKKGFLMPFFFLAEE